MPDHRTDRTTIPETSAGGLTIALIAFVLLFVANVAVCVTDGAVWAFVVAAAVLVMAVLTGRKLLEVRRAAR